LVSRDLGYPDGGVSDLLLDRDVTAFVERCPCCREPIDTYGCACLPSEARPALSNRTGRTDLDPDNWPDEVGIAEDDRLSDTG
jgi:hypothetical protein